MKLLFDENLSPRLPRLVADLFPDSKHVREAELTKSADLLIWEYARRQHFAIVIGAPPKVVFGEAQGSDCLLLSINTLNREA